MGAGRSDQFPVFEQPTCTHGGCRSIQTCAAQTLTWVPSYRLYEGIVSSGDALRCPCCANNLSTALQQHKLHTQSCRPAQTSAAKSPTWVPSYCLCEGFVGGVGARRSLSCAINLSTALQRTGWWAAGLHGPNLPKRTPPPLSLTPKTSEYKFSELLADFCHMPLYFYTLVDTCHYFCHTCHTSLCRQGRVLECKTVTEDSAERALNQRSPCYNAMSSD